MTTQDLSIDFGELEVESWEEEEEDLRRNFAHSSKVPTSNLRSITNESPFLDYSSFLAHIFTHNIEVIPESDLKRISRLGFGATMTVFKGTCPSRWGDTEVALKRLNLELPQTKSTLPPNSEELYHLMAAASLEVRVLSNSVLRYHPNIVHLLGVSWEELGGKDETQTQLPRSIRPILIVELACPQYPTLDEYYKYSAQQGLSIDLSTKVSLTCDIASALSAVHFCGIIHGDIKPQNILIFRKGPNEPLIAKLADFGGCQPPENEEAVDASLHQFAVLGTEYWNAPEVLSLKGEPSLLSRKATRDYYSMGLLMYYILFEEMLFGDDQDNSDGNLERIAKIKNDPLLVQELVRRKMVTRWPIPEEANGMKELRKIIASPGKRLELVQKLYANIKVFSPNALSEQPTDGFHRNGYRTSKSCQYPLYLMMRQFLHHDPETRRRGDLMREPHLLLGDDVAAQAFKTVYSMGDWDHLQSGVGDGVIRAWEFCDPEAAGSITAPGRTRYRVEIQDYQPNSITRSIYPFDWDNVPKIPHSLWAGFLQELNTKSRKSGDFQQIPSLLALELYGTLGFSIGRYEPGQYALEAAQIGSVFAKYIVLGTDQISRVDERTRCIWMLDFLLDQMPSKDRFTQRILDTFPDFTYLFTEFRTYAYVYATKDVKKIFEIDSGDSAVIRSFSAVTSGQVAQAKALLSENMENINVKVNGFNLLHAASEYGNDELIRVLIRDFGMDVNELNSSGVPPITLAARAKNRSTVLALLRLGADTKRFLCARTLRQLANYDGYKMIKRLYYLAKAWADFEPGESISVESFLDGNFTAYPNDEVDDDEPEFPPIISAILGDNIFSLLVLLELGCTRDIYTKFTNGSLAPIHIAANLRPLFLALLLDFGALPDLRTRDHAQSTVLHLVCTAYKVPTYYHPRVVKTTDPLGIGALEPPDYLKMKLFMIKLLVKEYGVDVDAQDFYGRTAISLCMSGSDNISLTEYLIEECGANIHTTDFRGLSCLHRAIIGGSGLEYIEFCIKRGVDINGKDLHERTPLIFAVYYSTVKICKYLLDHGADLLATHSEGWTSLDIAISDSHTEVAGYLFGVAEKRQFLPTLVSMEDKLSHTLIHKIIAGGEDTSSKYLPRFTKADISRVLEKPDIVGNTILHHAVFTENTFAIEFLLQLGANINAKGWRGITPLHIAYGEGSLPMIEMLEKVENIDLGCCDITGRTPEDFGKLSTVSPEFWTECVGLCNEEGKERSKGKYDIDINAIEAENRRKGAPKEGWFVE